MIAEGVTVRFAPVSNANCIFNIFLSSKYLFIVFFLCVNRLDINSDSRVLEELSVYFVQTHR